MRGKIKLFSILILIVSSIVFSFQNCTESEIEFSSLGELGVCENVSCDLRPLTYKAAVSTILIALGDEADSQLVVNGASAQLIAETVVRYTTPKENPKILLVLDHANEGESKEDTFYVRDVLLKRYNVDFLEEPDSGIKAEDLNGYDLVWLNNPGHPFGSENTFNVLLNYSGGVVLQGDDFSRGSNFNPQPLTGLKYIDNGSVVVCNGNRYNHDNNDGEKYRVTLDPTKIPGADNSTIAFEYGNDIDLSEITRQDLEVLAYAQGGPSECTEKRPAIVRYQK